MINKTGADAVHIKTQCRVRKLFRMSEYMIVFLITHHPGIRKENIGAVITFQHCIQYIVIVIKLHIAKLNIRIYLVESVKFSFQCLKIIIASDYRDVACRICLERRRKSLCRFFRSLAGACAQRCKNAYGCNHADNLFHEFFSPFILKISDVPEP